MTEDDIPKLLRPFARLVGFALVILLLLIVTGVFSGVVMWRLRLVVYAFTRLIQA